MLQIAVETVLMNVNFGVIVGAISGTVFSHRLPTTRQGSGRNQINLRQYRDFGPDQHTALRHLPAANASPRVALRLVQPA